MGIELLNEVSNWKLEAKLESSKRYFYHTRAVDRLMQGQKSYVIGRKGTGKTAICQHLASQNKAGYFSQKLTFKNFPFNRLYDLSDKGFTAPNQYITLWKYLIYTTTCKLLSKNPEVDVGSRETLAKLFDVDISNALPAAIEKWTDVKFELKVLGTGGGVQLGKTAVATAPLELGERVDTLERFIGGRLGAETYVILFDELDEDYKDMLTPETHTRYTQLLTSLFKAIQDVRSKFRDFRVYPIVFLRDDIYDVLQDSDKTKWSDYKIDLAWDEEAIKNLLAFRISRALSADAEPRPFTDAWALLYAGGNVEYGNRQLRRMSAFDYITRSSQIRPRDYIRYLQVCADQALEQHQIFVTSDIVRSEDKSFSNYLRSELEDEIHSIIPEISKIMNIFSFLRKQTLSIDEFIRLHDEQVKQQEVPRRDAQFILQILFHFSVIGNVPKQANHHVFKYLNREARLNMSDRICVHRGLFKSLQIL
jgi:hypothetical protein